MIRMILLPVNEGVEQLIMLAVVDFAGMRPIISASSTLNSSF